MGGSSIGLHEIYSKQPILLGMVDISAEKVALAFHRAEIVQLAFVQAPACVNYVSHLERGNKDILDCYACVILQFPLRGIAAVVWTASL